MWHNPGVPRAVLADSCGNARSLSWLAAVLCSINVSRAPAKLLVRVAYRGVRDAADIGVNYGLEFEGSAGRRAATASRC